MFLCYVFMYKMNIEKYIIIISENQHLHISWSQMDYNNNVG